jgi:hypothetical protein
MRVGLSASGLTAKGMDPPISKSEIHYNARHRVFPLTRANRVGTLLMFAVRDIFSRPELLRTTIRDLVATGESRNGSPRRLTLWDF